MSSKGFQSESNEKRSRQKTKRFGNRESTYTYDSFFDQALQSVEKNINSAVPNENQSNIFSETKIDQVYDQQSMTNVIIATIDAITKQVFEMTAKMKSFEEIVSQPLNRVENAAPETTSTQSNLIKLPIETTDGLDDFELKLKTRSFKIIVVSQKTYLYLRITSITIIF